MGSANFHTFTDTPAFWRVAEDEHRGIHVMRLHPKSKMAQVEQRVRAELPRCEFHWPRPDPGFESEHRGDCWLVFPGAGDATRALGVLRGWKFGNWHIKTKRAKRETPPADAPASPLASCLNSPPPLLSPLLLPEPVAAAPSHPIAFVNTTAGDVTVVTQVAQGPIVHQQPESTGSGASPAILSEFLDWRKWGTKELR